MSEKDLIAVAGAVLLLVFLGSVGMMGFFGFHVFFIGVGLLLLVLLVVFLGKCAGAGFDKGSHEVLRKRLAVGEISLKEYEKLRKVLA